MSAHGSATKLGMALSTTRHGLLLEARLSSIANAETVSLASAASGELTKMARVIDDAGVGIDDGSITLKLSQLVDSSLALLLLG